MSYFTDLADVVRFNINAVLILGVTDISDKGSERDRGIFTKNDKEWLEGESNNPADQKRRCKQGLQHALEDIRKLVETDPDEVNNFEGIGELFDEVEQTTEMDHRRQCAEKLIALAFIITNQPIDYSEFVEGINWHPRKESDPVRTDDRPKSVRPPGYDVDELLSFREALANGVKHGKDYIGDTDFEGDARYPLFKSNINLYKNPTADRINSEGNEISMDVKRDIVAGYLDVEELLISPNEDQQTPSSKDYHYVTKTPGEKDILWNLNQDDRQSLSRQEVAEFLADDIKRMVNAQLVARHKFLAGGTDFPYMTNEGDELAGITVPGYFGRRPTDNDEEQRDQT